ncbi:MAG: hypothetical protein Q9214_003077 [Letrouitia sp. 1 TL-2023]
MALDSTLSPANTQSLLRLILSCAVEYRVAVLKHVADPQALRSLVLSCSAFSTAYYSHKRQILLHMVRNTFDVDKVNIVIPLLACSAQHVDILSPTHLKTVTTLLKANPEHIELTKQATLQITVEECKKMLRLKSIASQICSDLISQVPLHHPLGREDVISYKPLSPTERRRITIAIYRWELWAQLFSQLGHVIFQRHDPAARIDINTQRAVYLARYTRWEKEQLSCLYEYVHRRYEQLFEESARWYHEKNPGPFSGQEAFEENMKPWEVLRNDCAFPFDPYSNWIFIRITEANIKFLCKAISLPFNLVSIISRGPQVLASLLKNTDPGWKCEMIMECIYNVEPSFVEVVSPEYEYRYTAPEWREYTERVYIPATDEEDIGAQKDDQPYGYKWAFANKSINPGDPSFWSACDFLWHWGYAFWDEDRLQNWGFGIGGPFYYKDGIEEGIFDRASGRQLQEPQRLTNLVSAY